MGRNEDNKSDNAGNQEAVLSPEEIALAEKKAVAKKKRDEARILVRSFLADLKDAPLKAAITLLVGSGQRSSGTSGVNNLLMKAFIEKGNLSEMEIFKQFHIGRPDMKNKVRIFIKFVDNPEDRIWVSFDPETEVYTMDGQGIDPPDGWEGYTIVEENVL